MYSRYLLGVSDYVLSYSKQEELITCVKDAYAGRSRSVRRDRRKSAGNSSVKQRKRSFLYNSCWSLADTD